MCAFCSLFRESSAGVGVLYRLAYTPRARAPCMKNGNNGHRVNFSWLRQERLGRRRLS